MGKNSWEKPAGSTLLTCSQVVAFLFLSLLILVQNHKQGELVWLCFQHPIIQNEVM